jgi:hypothetical protein
MNKVVKILMERDGLTQQQAKELVEETRDALQSCDPFEAEDIIADYLGLELDYIFDILNI